MAFTSRCEDSGKRCEPAPYSADNSGGATEGVWQSIYASKWVITGVCAAVFAAVLVGWLRVCWWQVGVVAVTTIGLAGVWPDKPMISFGAAIVGLCIVANLDKGQANEWFAASWSLAKQILPLLLIGVLVAGMLLGRPGREGLLPSGWVNEAVGGNSIGANFFASLAGALMYFATLTEVPILKGLIGNGMGQGPALALLLAGPALSLPNMLVIRSILGTKKTVVYVCLVVIAGTISGVIFGSVVGT